MKHCHILQLPGQDTFLKNPVLFYSLGVGMFARVEGGYKGIEEVSRIRLHDVKFIKKSIKTFKK